MRMQESAMDDLNQKATDILECPECECEEVFLLHKQTKEEAEGTELNWQCLDCGYEFKEQI